jgi:hypothetical protein
VREMKVEKRKKEKRRMKYRMGEVETGRKMRCMYAWKEELRIGHWKTRRGKRRDSFIAKTLFKILRKLPPLHVSDFVRRIPLPLQTLNSQKYPHWRSYNRVYNTAPRMIQQMRQLPLFRALPEVATHATPNKRSDTKL